MNNINEPNVQVPPLDLCPWYYQYWFLYPSFVIWPLWSILTIRSPWHNHFLFGSVAWAHLFVGTYFLVYMPVFEGGNIQSTILFTLPSLIFIPITQIHWSFVQKPKIKAWHIETEKRNQIITQETSKRKKPRKHKRR